MSTSAGKQITLAFDLYGTLLSTSSIAKALASHFGDSKANTIATTWRKHQLEYTWRLNSMGQYHPFSSVTRSSLIHALAETSSKPELSSSQIDALISEYDSLSTFPDVAPALDSISKDPCVTAVIFSNGTMPMLMSSLRSSVDLSPHASVFQQIVSVEPVQKYKPHADVYGHLVKEVGKSEREGEVWLISGNPFDVVGAKAIGMKAVWVDREGKGWDDMLIAGDRGRPDLVVQGLGEVVEKVRAFG